MRHAVPALCLVLLVPSVTALEGNYDPPANNVAAEHVFVGDFVVATLFESDTKILYGDLKGAIKRYDLSTGKRETLFTAPAITGPEWGLTGLAEDAAGSIYTMYTTGPPGIDPELDNVSGELRVSRWVDGKETIIFVTEATRSHNGGRLLFHNDTLFVTLGEHTRGSEPMQKRMTAQDPGSLGGKILRMTIDGKPAPGNPAERDPRFHPLVYSMGHRNPFGIDWDPRRDILAISDPAQDHNEEVNHVPVGGNLGWPLCVGPCKVANASLIDPLVHYPESITPVGLKVVGEDYYIGSFTHKEVRRIYETPAGWTDEVVAVLEDGILEVSASPDGKWIYAGTWNGVWRFPTPVSTPDDPEPSTPARGLDAENGSTSVPALAALGALVALTSVAFVVRRLR